MIEPVQPIFSVLSRFLIDSFTRQFSDYSEPDRGPIFDPTGRSSFDFTSNLSKILEITNIESVQNENKINLSARMPMNDH